MVLVEIIIVTIALALFFDFSNGFHDAANSISTIVATRVLTPVRAVGMAASMNFLGIVFLFLGLSGVAATVGKGIIEASFATPVVILASIIGAIFWNLFTWWLGIPSSSSHALIGGLVGGGLASTGVSGLVPVSPQATFWVLEAALVGAAGGIVVWVLLHLRAKARFAPSSIGFGALFGAVFAVPVLVFLLPPFTGVKIGGLLAVVTFIAVSPLLGMGVSYLMSVGVIRVVNRVRPHPVKANSWFRKLQVFSSAFYSFNHGINDAQKTMGVMALLLILYEREITGVLPGEFHVPLWVALSAFGAIALGTFLGGWRIVKTMAMKITALKPYQGFCAETGGGGVLNIMAMGGIPVSTTHAIAGSIMGVGAVHGLSMVRWGVTRRLVVAWIVTIPASALVAALSYIGLRSFVGA